jgi:hypothetical protein
MNVTIDNFIGIFEDAYTKEYCDSVIKYFNDMEKAGFTLTRQAQNTGVAKLHINDTQLYGTDEVCATSTGALSGVFNNIFWGQIYQMYANKFDILTKADPHTNYSFKIQKTNIGEGYHIWHFETDSRMNCNRLFAWMLYLNDVDEGGETEFLYYPKRIKPKAGTLLLWPAGFTHTHRGNPPISNTKYIITGWVVY